MSRSPDAQLTHFGLYVRDMDAMVAFYVDLLGLVVTDKGEFNGNRITFLSRNPDEHHQLVLVTGRPADEYSPVSQMSFRVPSLEDLQTYYRSVKSRGLRGLKPSNHGNAWSIYFLDIEGNRLEIYTSSPWYVNQPYQSDLNLDDPADEIRESTLAMVKKEPSFTSHDAWRRSLSERLEQPAL